VESRMGVPLDVPVEQTELGTPGALAVGDAGPVNSAGGVDEIRGFGEIRIAFVSFIQVLQYVFLKKL
jgi:hypothetical protein